MKYERRKAKRLARKAARNADYDNFDKVFTYEHMMQSYRNCKKGVIWKPSVQTYAVNAPYNLAKTLKELRDGTFKSKGFYEFDLFERGKLRHIQSVMFGERIIQRCLCDYSLTPLLSRTFIYDNGASLKGKGYTFSMKRLDEHLHRHYRKYGSEGYILLLDFSKFFENIPHDYLKEILRREYSDPRLIGLIEYFIDLFDGERGLGLGSQVSQTLALAAANEYDHFIKERLGIRGYGRYMDDSYLIHRDRDYLVYCLSEIRKICGKCGIRLNDKKVRICRLTEPFTFLKARIFLTDSGRIVKRVYKGSVVRMRRKLKKFRKTVDAGAMTISDVYESFQSWRSHAEMLNAYHAIQNMEKLYNELFGEPFLQKGEIQWRQVQTSKI